MTGKLYFLELKIQLHELLNEVRMITAMPLRHTEEIQKISILHITKCDDCKFWYLGSFQSRDKYSCLPPETQEPNSYKNFHF